MLIQISKAKSKPTAQPRQVAFVILLGSLAQTAWALSACAGNIPIPNASFELPVTVFVNVHIDSWQKSPQPEWYTNAGGFTWEQLTGEFKNTATNSPDHIDNCEGNQASWLFAVPQVGFFQDYDSLDGTNLVPSHSFNAVYVPGNTYELTVGLVGGGGNMSPGASLELSLYFRDSSSNMVTVATKTITQDLATFPSTTHLVDCSVQVPMVKPGDPWAGQHIGVQLLSTISSELAGGYWDVDNFRLTATAAPVFLNPNWTNGQFSVTLRSEPGLKFEILASSSLQLPEANWTSLGTLTNLTGLATITDGATGLEQRYYFARQIP